MLGRDGFAVPRVALIRILKQGPKVLIVDTTSRPCKGTSGAYQEVPKNLQTGTPQMLQGIRVFRGLHFGCTSMLSI